MTDMVDLALRDVITALSALTDEVSFVVEGVPVAAERRRWALLHAAAAIQAGAMLALTDWPVKKVVDRAEELLREIESREER